MKYLVIYQCPVHPTFRSAAIEEIEGNGTRVLGGKCCPKQYTVTLAKFPLTPDALRDLREELAHL